MSHRPKLTLVKNCGAARMDKSAALARANAAHHSPIHVGPDFLAGDQACALTLHIDDHSLTDVFAGGKGLSDVPKRRAASRGKPLLPVNGKGFQILADALHGSSLPTGKKKAIPAGHLLAGDTVNNHGMDSNKKRTQEVRLKRLMQLREKFPLMNDGQFADLLGLTPDYYSRLKGYPNKAGSKAIGDICREWERLPILGIDLGWFDRDENETSPAPHPAQLTAGALRVAYAYDDLSKEGRLEIEQRIAKLSTDKKATVEVVEVEPIKRIRKG